MSESNTGRKRPHPPSLEEIVALRATEPELAQELFVARFYQDVRLYLLKVTGSPELAKDAVQGTFLEWFRRYWETLTPETPVAKLLRRTCHTQLRKEWRWRNRHVFPEEMPDIADPAPECAPEDDEFFRDLAFCIRALDDEDQLLIERNLLDGTPLRDLEAEFGLKHSALCNRKQRVLTRLRACLERHGWDEASYPTAYE